MTGGLSERNHNRSSSVYQRKEAEKKRGPGSYLGIDFNPIPKYLMTSPERKPHKDRKHHLIY